MGSLRTVDGDYVRYTGATESRGASTVAPRSTLLDRTASTQRVTPRHRTGCCASVTDHLIAAWGAMVNTCWQRHAFSASVFPDREEHFVWPRLWRLVTLVVALLCMITICIAALLLWPDLMDTTWQLVLAVFVAATVAWLVWAAFRYIFVGFNSFTSRTHRLREWKARHRPWCCCARPPDGNPNPFMATQCK